jgi:hypothetical protein
MNPTTNWDERRCSMFVLVCYESGKKECITTTNRTYLLRLVDVFYRTINIPVNTMCAAFFADFKESMSCSG